MAAQLQAQGVHLRLNTPVTAISTISSSSSSGGGDGGAACSVAVTVTASTGGVEPLVVQASCLVVALSPPLWACIAWSPPLSPAKQAVAQRMYMGAAVKTIAVYDECFWRPSGFKPQGQLEELGPVANLFPSTVDGAPALVGLVTAGAAKAFAELSEKARRAQVLEQYRRYFGSEQAVQGCVAFHSKDWVHEPFSRGCYAALMPPGLAASVGQAARAPEGHVCFAGTELATSWPGYFEGALDAGYRAAGEVVALLAAGQASQHSSSAAGAAEPARLS